MPERRPGGRPGPPKGYPEDQSLYADPLNWKYPVHTPTHARRARQYFDRESNRAKYSPQEQAYMDAKINEALGRFGVAKASVVASDSPLALGKLPEEMSADELLESLLGKSRLKRARAAAAGQISLHTVSSLAVRAEVRGYAVTLDIAALRIEHDCPDWRRQRSAGKVCKHIGALLIALDPEVARPLLRSLALEQWHSG